ncbi:unnamed protein product, partial [Schistosoma bovis]
SDEFPPTISVSWINVNDNDLPWKYTPPSRNSFSNGIRRSSSFFRSFNQRSSSFNTSRTEMMPSMPVLPTLNYLIFTIDRSLSG